MKNFNDYYIDGRKVTRLEAYDHVAQKLGRTYEKKNFCRRDRESDNVKDASDMMPDISYHTHEDKRRKLL